VAEAFTLPHVALVGNPNAGKTALFNALTGARQKVANYPGVTVERKAAKLMLPDGFEVELIDLPGTYSLSPKSPDEAVTANVLSGAQAGEKRPEAIICVLDASNLRNHLKFALELKAQGLPMIIALNMTDLAKRDGIEIDVEKLQALLAMPVISTVAVRKSGLADLMAKIAPLLNQTSAAPQPTNVQDLHARANDMLAQVMINEGAGM
jgi:ferrous iron transport protein B